MEYTDKKNCSLTEPLEGKRLWDFFSVDSLLMGACRRAGAASIGADKRQGVMTLGSKLFFGDPPLQ